MKKTLLITAALLAMAGSVQAYGDHEDWDCGNALMVTQWKNELSVSNHKYSVPLASGIKRKGEAAFKFKWDFGDGTRDSKMTVNGKACHRMSDMDWYRQWCKDDTEKNSDSCEQVKAQEEWEKNQRVSCENDSKSEACEHVRYHERWLRARKEECKKNPTLLICEGSATPAAERK